MSGYLPKLLAAVQRLREVDMGGGPTWSAALSVYLAADAVEGDEEARHVLDTERSWQLTAAGKLPTAEDDDRASA